MAEKIYNAEYVAADPDFVHARPRYFAGILQDIIGPVKGTVTALDFGGGKGLLAALMREAGFPDFASYDPFFGGTVAAVSHYDLVTAFEVMEHTRDPIGTFREVSGLLRPDGALLSPTLLQPPRLDATWWYMAPRNGHASLHSRRNLQTVARLLDMAFLSISDGLHLFYRSPPNRVMRSVAQRGGRPVLRYASMNGIGHLLDSSRQVARLGEVRAVLDPRHAGRALLRRLGMPVGR